VLPDGARIQLRDVQVLVPQVANEVIALDIALVDDLTSPISSTTHSGVLTQEKIDLIARWSFGLGYGGYEDWGDEG
jgi:hypothetical protein